jgi:hypothetical protein
VTSDDDRRPDEGVIVRGMILEWLAATAGVAALIYFGSRATGGGTRQPLALCIEIPAVLFGFGQLTRYLRHRLSRGRD